MAIIKCTIKQKHDNADPDTIYPRTSADMVEGISNYLLKSGGIMSGYFGTIFSTRAFYPFVSNGMYNYSNANKTGMILITLPNIQMGMMKFTVSIYNYETGTSSDYIICGYNYSDGTWYNVSAYCIGKGSKANLKVRYFKKYSNTGWRIGIGEATTVWQYPQITIKDVEIGFSDSFQKAWYQGWSITITTTPPSASDEDKAVTNTGFSGYNHTHDYLPLSGGTLYENGNNFPLILKTGANFNSSSGIWLKFAKSDGTTAGFLGVRPDSNDVVKPMFHDGSNGGVEISLVGHTHSQYLTSHQDISGKVNGTSLTSGNIIIGSGTNNIEASNVSLSDLVAVAEGKTKTYVCTTQSGSANRVAALDSQEDGITIQTSFKTTSGDTINVTDLQIGDVILVESENVPDRWVAQFMSSDTVLLRKLETRSYTIPASLDDLPDGSTRALSNYLPLSGGKLSSTLPNALSIKRTIGNGYGTYIDYMPNNQEQAVWRVGATETNKFGFEYTADGGTTRSRVVNIETDGTIAAVKGTFSGAGSNSTDAAVAVSNGTITISNYSNTVKIGNLNTGYCHFQNSTSIPFYFNRGVFVDGNLYMYGSSDNATFLSKSMLSLIGAASNPSASAGARICFQYYNTATDKGQPVYISYCPNDSYRAPYGLRIWGSDGTGTGAWLEVEGKIYTSGNEVAIKSDAHSYEMSGTIAYNRHEKKITCSKSTNGWDAHLYSKDGYVDNVFVTFKAGQTNAYIMVGLNSDPTTDANYNTIDYCWYIQANGNIGMYESGSSISSITGHTTYAAGDEFRIEYSDGRIRYYHNGVLCRDVKRAISGKLYLDSSFYSGSGNVYDVEFGPFSHTEYAESSARLYSEGSTYGYNGTNPYYARLRWNVHNDSRWYLSVSPESPKEIRVDYAAEAGYAASSGSSTTAATANKVAGSYTANGGQQGPKYFGTNKVGFLMMNTLVNGNSHYKDWAIMDCYSGNDVGGAVAFGVNRQALGAYIMRSNSSGSGRSTTWDEKAELFGTHKLSSTTSLGTIGTTDKLYPVGVDANGKLCVNVPWSDTDTDSYESQLYTSGVQISEGHGQSEDLYVPTGTTSGTVAAGDHTHSYLPLSGGTVDGSLIVKTYAGTNKFTIQRQSTSEQVEHYVDDSGFRINYKNDESSSSIVWTVTNTDTEANNGANPSTHTLSFNSSNSGANLKIDNTAVSLEGHTHSYLPLSGGTMTGLITAKVNADQKGIKLGNSYLNAIGTGSSNDVIFQNATLRFGHINWDYDKWAGLKYDSTNKIVYLGIADGTVFTANNPQSNGKLYLPGISSIYVGNGTTSVSLTGHNHDNTYLPLSGGTLTNSNAGILELQRSASGGAFIDYYNNNQTTNWWRVGSNADNEFSMYWQGNSNVFKVGSNGNTTITGTLFLTKTQDLSGTANNGPALIVGGAATSTHMEFDCNEIQAKSNGTTPTNIYINGDGGRVNLAKAHTVDNVQYYAYAEDGYLYSHGTKVSVEGHTHSYIKSKENYTFTSQTLPNSFDFGVSAGFVASDSGFGSFGTVLTVRTYTGGGGTLQLWAPYSPTYGGTHMKARFGNYDSSNGNSWTTLKEIAWTSDIPSVSNATITIKQTGQDDQTFTLNGSAATITLADTNTKVTQTVVGSTYTALRPILISGGTYTASGNATNFATNTDATLITNAIYAQPSTGSLYATKLYSGGTEVLTKSGGAVSGTIYPNTNLGTNLGYYDDQNVDSDRDSAFSNVVAKNLWLTSGDATGRHFATYKYDRILLYRPVQNPSDPTDEYLGYGTIMLPSVNANASKTIATTDQIVTLYRHIVQVYCKIDSAYYTANLVIINKSATSLGTFANLNAALRAAGLAYDSDGSGTYYPANGNSSYGNEWVLGIGPDDSNSNKLVMVLYSASEEWEIGRQFTSSQTSLSITDTCVAIN